MEIPYQYETRHKALLGIDWNKSNECQRNEHTLWRIWQPNDNCKLIPKKNIWPNYIISMKNNSSENEIFSSRDYKYDQLTRFGEKCKNKENYDCKYINKLTVKIDLNDFKNSGKILKNNIISIKLPKYLNHLSTTIFDNANHITLSTNYGFKFQAAQGYLISQDHLI